MMNNKITQIPKYGLKLNLDHEYPEKWPQAYIPRWRQVFVLLPLMIGYIYAYIKSVLFKKPIVMDYLNIITGKQIYGVPLGGIGGGTIGRGYRGEFCRFQLKPGIYNYNTVEANEFIITIKDSSDCTLFQSTLSTYKRSNKYLKTWKQLLDASQCKYTGLYPRSWTEYDLSEYGIKLICRQVSPVIPHNYKDSSLPCAMFLWNIHNITTEERKVTIAFTFKNGVGDKSDIKSPCSTKSFSCLDSSGVVLYNSIDKMPCTYVLAAKQKDNMNISKCLYFDPNSDGEEPWKQLFLNGNFEKLSRNETDEMCKEMACGIAVQVTVNPGSVEEPEMCLAWDMPVVHFPVCDKKYTRFYTKHFGNEKASLKIVNYALNNYKEWESLIYQWQQPVLDDDALPSWYKAALFNESYFISDGGTVWLTLSDEESEKLSVTDPRQKYGRFAYLEGHEYRMYNTYDVHFYASYALVMNWPHLQQIIQYDIKDFIDEQDLERRRMWYNFEVVERKRRNCVPHDIGDPNESPFKKLNAYPVHDVSDWKDLNTKFVLQVLRDFQLTKSFENSSFGKKYLEDMYEACHKVMHKSMSFDKDHDCLIENSGFPDQTYDTWVMTGASAYCGGLWVAALYAMVNIARELNKNRDKDMYAAILEKAKSAYENKLWNGRYYNFDSKSASTVMSDQLCGHWYLRASGFDYEVFPQSNVKSALKMVFENNVMSYKNGTSGAVNGYILDKGVDTCTLQSEEIWTGVTYALGSCMMFEDLTAEAWKTIGGMIHTLTNRIGMVFETPEALGFRHYRAVGYMRPLSIWAVQLAWENKKLKSVDKTTIPTEGEGELQH